MRRKFEQSDFGLKWGLTSFHKLSQLCKIQLMNVEFVLNLLVSGATTVKVLVESDSFAMKDIQDCLLFSKEIF